MHSALQKPVIRNRYHRNTLSHNIISTISKETYLSQQPAYHGQHSLIYRVIVITLVRPSKKKKVSTIIFLSTANSQNSTLEILSRNIVGWLLLLVK